MRVSKAVITAAARNQRTLPLQTLVDRDGQQKTVLNIIVEEALRAGIEDICMVICPGDEAAYRLAAGEYAASLHFVAQAEPMGYGHAVYCARDFTAAEPFLHMVGDHIYVSSRSGALNGRHDSVGNDHNGATEEVVQGQAQNVVQAGQGCAQELVAIAETQACAVSGVQPTRENLLPYFGTVGGQRVKGNRDLYLVERVAEKPTPTEAEQTLIIPGLRAGHYLCFFGMHVLTPLVMEILEQHVQARTSNQDSNNQNSKSQNPVRGVQLSPVLDELARRERYLAFEAQGRRYPIDARYGLLTAQLALALSGQDREEVLAGLCELLAQREQGREVSITGGVHGTARNIV